MNLRNLKMIKPWKKITEVSLVMTLLPMPYAKAETYNELSQETCFARYEMDALARREKECQKCDLNLSACEVKFESALERGLRPKTLFDEPVFWLILGGIVGGTIRHNLK